jgi:hypothetical protein
MSGQRTCRTVRGEGLMPSPTDPCYQYTQPFVMPREASFNARSRHVQALRPAASEYDGHVQTVALLDLHGTRSLGYTRLSQQFRYHRRSSPCSQEPSTGPYPEPVQSSPYRLILFHRKHLNILRRHFLLHFQHALFS